MEPKRSPPARCRLVDELRLTIDPVLVAQGKPLFAATERRGGLVLEGSKTFADFPAGAPA